MQFNVTQIEPSHVVWSDSLGRRVIFFTEKGAKPECLAHKDLMGGQVEKIREAQSLGKRSVEANR